MHSNTSNPQKKAAHYSRKPAVLPRVSKEANNSNSSPYHNNPTDIISLYI